MIDRESFNQLISGLDEIRTKYVDDGKASRKYVAFGALISDYHFHSWIVTVNHDRSLFLFFLFLFLKIHVFSCRIHDAFAHVQLSDIRVIATLGVGGFGRVELVQISNDTSRSYGLKQMKKSQVEKLVITNGHLSCV